MSNVTITQLPVVTSISSSDVIPVVASGVTSQISSANFGTSVTAATASFAFTSVASTVATTATFATYAVTASNINPLSQSVIISGAVNLISTGQTALTTTGTQNGYIEFSMRNTSAGVSASGDMVVYANNGTTASNHIDMGINNSGVAPGFSFGTANDAYFYNTGGNLWIGNSTAYYQSAITSQSLFLFTNVNSLPDVTITGSKMAVGYNFTVPQYTLDVSGSGNYNNGLNVTGSQNISGSLTSTNIVVLSKVSSSYNFANDAAAAAGGIPLGGLYRNANAIQIRLV